MHTSRRFISPSFLRNALALVFALAIGLSSCARPEAEAKRYDLRGKVVSVDRAKGEVVLDHEEIRGYMAAMQMPFKLRDRDALAALAGGDLLQATLVVSETDYWLENPVVTKGLPGADAGAAEAVAAGPPPGTQVPDVALVNQDGERLSLDRLRGRALLLTFIYTRCPVPDYCPLMSSNFAAVHRELERDAALRPKAHLLSVTLDPAYDTPKVLRSYGAAYTERYGEETFEHWDFATGDPAEICRLAQFFGLAYREESGQVVHSLRTALVAPDGKVYKIYRGNEWKPEEVLADLRRLLSGA
ncbi:MAG: SCO family protein [Acidobacteriota bacterium]|nr:SCO family protein [Acidobacteriota bacterium]